LPFGGVGPAGMGRYHGQAGFDAMSNLRSVVRKPLRPDLDLAYPPYTDTKKRLVRAAVPSRWSPRERFAAWLGRFAPLKPLSERLER
ncbi:MAG: hypothetical protein OEZ14_05690, partial [Acidimicrobiia bacterium]|nr:hypothetical protein [Acidimicrobiia bacterium]